MSAEELASLAGIALSLIFSYTPGLSVKFAALEGVYKRLIMVGMLALTAGAVYGLSCAGWLDAVSCDEAGIRGLVMAFVAAVVANQAAYMITPETKAVAEAREARKRPQMLMADPYETW